MVFSMWVAENLALGCDKVQTNLNAYPVNFLQVPPPPNKLNWKALGPKQVLATSFKPQFLTFYFTFLLFIIQYKV